MGLAAIQALNFQVPLPPSMRWPVILWLSALALALPPAVVHWSGGLPAGSRWLYYGIVAALGATTSWLGVTIVWRRATHSVTPVQWSVLVALLGTALLTAVTVMIDRRRGVRVA